MVCKATYRRYASRVAPERRSRHAIGKHRSRRHCDGGYASSVEGTRAGGPLFRGEGAVIFTGNDLFVTHYSVPDLLRGARSAPFQMSYRQARVLAAYVRFWE